MDMTEWQQRAQQLAEQEAQNQLITGGAGGSTQLVNMADINALNQYVASLPSSSGGSVNAVYSGLPTALGGTWGNTPQTLAEQQVAGGQISYTIQNPDGTTRQATPEEAARLTAYSISQLTPEQKQQYDATVAALNAAPGDTPQEKLAYVQKQRTQELGAARETKAAGSKDLAAKISGSLETQQEALQKAPEEGFKTASEPTSNIVQLKSGEYVDKTTYDKLSREDQTLLQEKGIQALNDKLQQEQKKADEERAQAIKDTTARLSELESKQTKYEAQSLWDKVKQTLNIPVTFQELTQEALTFGGAKTAAFDSDAIAKEYNEARLKALNEGYDLPVTEDEYKKQVLSKQATAAELGMMLVPFEYARPGRWDEMQLWEKIVYPVLDVVSLVPVVGLAGKGASAVAKGASTGAKIAALGGKSAVEFAAKDAALAAEKAATQKLIKEGLLAATKEAAKAATDKTAKQVLSGAVKAAEKDVAMASKEYNQIVKSATELNKLANIASKAEIPQKGAGAYKAATRVEEAAIKTGRYTEPIDITGSSGVIGYSTVANWNDLTPEQRAGGLALAALSSGIVGKGRNIAENIVDPHKIPISALKGRALPTKAKGGEIIAKDVGGLKGTTRLVLDHTIDPKDARATVADLMRQLTEGEDVAKATLKTTAGEKEVKIKGTGFQKTVGKTSISGTPQGEIFKEGTGAFGAKTNLEKYLRDANLEHGTNIEIEARPVKIGDTEIQAKTISAPGVTVKGTEGGLYAGASFYNQFAHKGAYGGTGKISSGLLIGTPGISELPKSVRNAKDMAEMEQKAYKAFDGAKNINKEVEGFKQFANYMEAENIFTNGSQLQRVQNLRSKLADKLHLNRGEYYTRDPKGKIELFQMYLEGGRTTPYTLKELYQLKGNALRNSLEDLFYGLEKKIDELKSGKIVSHKENIITKEEQIARAFNDIDAAVARKGITEAEGRRLKNEILSEYRSRLDTIPNRERVRKTIAELGSRSEAKRREDEAREREFIERVKAEREAIKRDVIYGETPRKTTRGRTEERGTIREEMPREALREVSRETLREMGRELPREAQREVPREQPRETTREIPREELRKAPREMPRETLREVPREIPREIPRGEPREAPGEKPKEVPREAPHGKPEETVKTNQIIKFIETSTEGKKKLKPEQIEGAIAWKQGFIYHLHYPPFGDDDVLYSREPIPGVKYHEGVGSAAKSAVTLYGEIPQNIRLDMGIVDIDISRAEHTGQPKLKFKGDPKQKTNYGKQSRSSIKISK